ncbi:MAG: acyl-CoA dehydrogenase family protein [Spirochaetaceae bacterium]
MKVENFGHEPISEVSSYIASLRESLRSYAAWARESVATVAGYVRSRTNPKYPALEQFAKLNEGSGPAPLAAFVPEAYGGRGQRTAECLSVLEELAYTSLPLSLIAGINGALFLQPLSRYAEEELQAAVFDNVINHGALGGLMITEPDFGSDALNMQTSFVREGDQYQLKGTKHWGGLTGHADYWLITAREQMEEGRLGRNINFFVWDKTQGGIQVREYYQSLGLAEIPYGRNEINVTLHESRRLRPLSSGVKMLLDVLHRSRLQFPGMAMGFLRRILDEARSHVERRRVGGRRLSEYDQVQDRIAEIEGAYTTCSAMCAYTSGEAPIDRDCSSLALPANVIKSVVTDLMQEASQSLLQLTGAAGYQRDTFAGRAIIDCRPFQIFEGSNDILYEQVAEAVLKGMRRAGVTRLRDYFATMELGRKAADRIGDLFDFRVDGSLPQRRLVSLGQALSRGISLHMVADLGDRGFNRELIETTLGVLKRSVARNLGAFHTKLETPRVEDYRDNGHWRGFVPAGA